MFRISFIRLSLNAFKCTLKALSFDEPRSAALSALEGAVGGVSGYPGARPQRAQTPHDVHVSQALRTAVYSPRERVGPYPVRIYVLIDSNICCILGLQLAIL
jgi:hypothetical protein